MAPASPRASRSSADPSSTLPPIEPAHLSEYVADIALELSQLTKTAELEFLSHLLEMVFVEAFTLSQKMRE